MCTVTYIPLGSADFILTSSRDIPFSRESAEHPRKMEEDGVKFWYPKDGKAGGTWIGVSDNNRLICLLNGGFEYHTSRTHYSKSRGLIVKELLKAKIISEAIKEIDLIGVEQFTLTIVDWNDELKLIEFVWDGVKKHIKSLVQQTYIWSSSTLYDQGVKELRKDWFELWQKENGISQQSILEFHHRAGIGDPFIDVMMNRGMGGTVSITSIKKADRKISIFYEDIRTQKSSELIIS